MLPTVIIGGTQKAGTTSVFRYLSDHSSVCASHIKEVDFFLRYKNKIDAEALKKYESYFSRCSSNEPVRLEASPRYLKLSDSVAALMHNYLPNIKLIFILREPVSVLISYINWKSTSRKKSLSIYDFISLAQDNCLVLNKDFENKNALGRLFAGCYANKLRDYLTYYSTDSIGIFFYDDLAQDIRGFMKAICNFLELDSSFYQNYQFNIENKTRFYKFPNIHRLVSRIYLKFEIFFNQYPSIRNQLRLFYHSLCAAPVKNYEITESHKMKLNEFYEPHNRNLSHLLKQKYPNLRLPSWLEK